MLIRSLEISLLNSIIGLTASMPPIECLLTVFLFGLNTPKEANLMVERALGKLNLMGTEGYMNLTRT